MNSAFNEVTRRGVGNASASCPTLLRGFELEKGRHAFVVVGDLELTFTILVVDVDDCRHRFFSVELQLPNLEQWFSTTVTRAACSSQAPFVRPSEVF